MVAVEGERERHRWLVASACLREENEISVLEYSEESSDAISTVKICRHPKEVVSLVSSPVNSELFGTVAGDGEAVIWRIPEKEGPSELIAAATLPSCEEAEVSPTKILWSQEPGSSTGRIVTLSNQIRVADFRSDRLADICRIPVSKSGDRITTVIRSTIFFI